MKLGYALGAPYAEEILVKLGLALGALYAEEISLKLGLAMGEPYAEEGSRLLLLVVWEQSNLLRSWKWENQLALAILTLLGAVPFGAPRRQANPLGMIRLVKVERAWLSDDLKAEGYSLRTVDLALKSRKRVGVKLSSLSPPRDWIVVTGPTPLWSH